MMKHDMQRWVDAFGKVFFLAGPHAKFRELVTGGLVGFGVHTSAYMAQ